MLSQKGNALIIGILIGLVVAGGLFGAYYFSKSQTSPPTTQVSVTVSPTPVSLSTTTVDATANWKVFTSKYFGFTQKYPNDWINDNFCQQCEAQPVIDSSSERYFHPDDAKYPKGITYMINSKQGTTLKLIEDKAKDWNIENKKVEDIFIDGYKGVKVSGLLEGADVSDAVFENKDFIFEITNHGEYKDILDLMLGTFKFTNGSLDINGFPVYPDAKLKETKDYPPCVEGQYSGFSICNATAYTWQVDATYDLVFSYYKEDKLKSGWVCGGGAGNYTDANNANSTTSCKKGNLNYGLQIETNSGVSKITLSIPKGTPTGN